MNRIGPHFRGPDIDAIVDDADNSDTPTDCACGCGKVDNYGDMVEVDSESYIEGHEPAVDITEGE